MIMNVIMIHDKMITRVGSRWGSITNPHAKVFDSPQHPQVPIKIFEIDMLTIFDLLTSPQGHQFDPRMKRLLAFCSARHPRRFDMPHDHVWKKMTPWAPPVPQCPTHGAWPRGQNKNPVWYVLYLSFVRTHTKFGINLWNWQGNWNLMIFDFYLTTRLPVRP